LSDFRGEFKVGSRADFRAKMPDPEQMSREQLIEARANVKRQIDELRYRSVAGAHASSKSPLIERLNAILAEKELAEMENPDA
jgi:hypothetical protein